MAYQAIRSCHEEYGYPIDLSCQILSVSRSAYYKWESGKLSKRQVENTLLAEKILEIHEAHPEKGYRGIRDDLEHYQGIHVNDKRVLRICRAKGIRSIIKYRLPGCTKADRDPQHIAANLLRRHFHADSPDEIWLTDVTEFKWYEGAIVHKLYLSAILDLYDRRIVAYVISDRNDNPLVFNTFRQAVRENPEAHPIFHSDRGFQYTNNTFHNMVKEAGMVQSISRKGECQDNGPMEGFWGILKRERYYGKAFNSRETLVEMIEQFIHYYNTERLQRKLGVVTPLEKNAMYYAAA